MPDKPTNQPDDQPGELPGELPASPKGTAGRRLLPLLPIGVGVVLGVALLAVILVVVIRSIVVPRDSGGIPLEITRISGSPGATPTAPAGRALVAEVGDTRVSLPAPVLLEFAELSFPVQGAAADEANTWATSFQPGGATWVHGTVINYVLALEPTAENQAAVENLQQGAPVLLRLSNGTRLTFRAAARREVTPNDPELLTQSGPGLTMVLPREDEQWLVVSADFEAAVEPPLPDGATAAAVGQAVQVGDARVVVQEGSVRSQVGVPEPQMMEYVVEFLLSNTGSSPLAPETFLMELTDGVGNRYSLSPTASQAGSYGLPAGPIGPGQEVNGSAGYVVPETLAGPTLTWVFSPDPSSELRASFIIPYTPDTASPPDADVNVYEAFLGEDGEVLHILADVDNYGDSSLSVTENDISLSSSAGPGQFQIAAPPLPWTIPGDDYREVELMFARPDASSCVVTILGFTFEISGLP